MTPEQRELLAQARESLAAARLLEASGYHGFAASRAYYAMFYVAEAFLLQRGLTFSRHTGVHSAFAEHFVRTGIVPVEFHRHLVQAMEIRHAGDYGGSQEVTREAAAEQITRAESFLALAEQRIAPA
jgi:uncharacterized protein (UPF0332 family)